MTHILVTGATGFIGSHLVRHLLALKEKEGWQEEILCLVRSTSDLSALKGLQVKLVIGDLRNPDSLIPAVYGAMYIYHLAAELYTVSREQFLAANVIGTENLLKAAEIYAKSSLKRFLLVSSLAAAGPAPGLEPITEEQEFGPPVSWYAESKQKVEKIARQYSSGLPITIVRPSGVYGPRDPGFSAAFKAARLRIQATIGFKTGYTGMVYAPDLVEGMVVAARDNYTAGKTYFLSNPVNYTIKEVGKTIGKAVGKPFGISIPIPIFIMQLAAIFAELMYLFTRQKPQPTRDKVRDLAQRFWLCSAKKAEKDFGWVAKTSFLEGAKLTNQYMLEEDKRMAEMSGDSTGTLTLKYILVGLWLGIVIELLAAFGKIYQFKPWVLMIGTILVLWGLVFGTIAKKMRRLSFVWQFLPGFFILFAAELVNHYYLHNWIFYPRAFFGLAELTPLARAIWLGLATGFIIPGINRIMKQLYRYQLRVG